MYFGINDFDEHCNVILIHYYNQIDVYCDNDDITIIDQYTCIDPVLYTNLLSSYS